MRRTLVSLALCLGAIPGLVAWRALAADAASEPTPKSAPPKDPYAAYEGGFYDQALSGFLDRQMSRPDEPHLSLAVGSAHYKMRSYEEAQSAYAAATQQGNPKLREQALYNLGNVAYRQGQLEEAVKLYQSALELDPNDQDAKFNLEFVRDEIRRRLEESKKRQEQQQQNQPEQDQQQQQQQQQGQDQQPQDGSKEQPQDSSQGQSGEQPKPQDQQGKEQGDGAQPQPQPGDEEQSAAEARPGSLTPEQAAQLLASLSEGEPKKRQRGRPTRARGGKDW